jgi:hypothetical protein
MCTSGGSRHLDQEEMRWWTIDSTVVHVDSLSGVVRALARGDARVWFRFLGRAALPENGYAGILVHVP